MSSGTDIVQRALQKLGAHSVASPAPPEAIAWGRDALNSLMQEWESRQIALGTVPLDSPGDELSEPLDARNAIIENLAVRLYPDFPSISDKTFDALMRNARNSYNFICAHYQTIEIPARHISSTTPLGAGNIRGRLDRTFAGIDKTVKG